MTPVTAMMNFRPIADVKPEASPSGSSSKPDGPGADVAMPCVDFFRVRVCSHGRVPGRRSLVFDD